MRGAYSNFFLLLRNIFRYVLIFEIYLNTLNNCIRYNLSKMGGAYLNIFKR